VNHAARLGPIAAWPVLGLLAVYAVFYLQFSLGLISFPYGWDQGEGYDAWSAWLMAQGQLPYSTNDAHPYFSINYPPIWATLVSVPMNWFGPSLPPARAFAALATLGVACLIALAARRRTATSWPLSSGMLAALLAGLFFLASPYVFHTTPLARVNSTLLFFGLAALALCEQPSTRRVALAVGCLLAALYTKPTAVGAAAAALGYVFLVDRRLALASGGALMALGLAGLVLLNLATDGAFWLNVVLGNAGPYYVEQLAAYMGNFLLLHGILLTLAAVEATIAIRRRAWSPWVLYLPASFVEIALSGESGAGESYFLGTIAACCVLAGSLSARVLSGERRAGAMAVPQSFIAQLTYLGHRRQGALLGVALLAQALLLSHGPLATAVPALADRGFQEQHLGGAPSEDARREGEALLRIIEGLPGPILVEEPSFALNAGREVIGNTTHLRTLWDNGLWDSAGLVSDVKARKFAVVVLSAHRYPPPVLEAIGGSYYLAETITLNRATYDVFLPGSN
jgi:hypothetical protein